MSLSPLHHTQHLGCNYCTASSQSLLSMALTSSQPVSALSTETPSCGTVIPSCATEMGLSYVTLIPSVKAIWIFSESGVSRPISHFVSFLQILKEQRNPLYILLPEMLRFL